MLALMQETASGLNARVAFHFHSTRVRGGWGGVYLLRQETSGGRHNYKGKLSCPLGWIHWILALEACMQVQAHAPAKVLQALC